MRGKKNGFGDLGALGGLVAITSLGRLWPSDLFPEFTDESKVQTSTGLFFLNGQSSSSSLQAAQVVRTMLTKHTTGHSTIGDKMITASVFLSEPN
eukprot:6257207-Amphidinium_carterae.1